MNRKERNQYVEQHIKDYLPQEYQQADVKVYEVNKRNGIMQDGLVVRQKGVAVSPILYLDAYDYSYPETALKKTAKDYVDIVASGQNMVEMLVEKMKEEENILNRVTLRAINRERNTVFLADKPYKKLQDLAFYPVVEITNNLSLDINYDLCSIMNLSGKEMLEIAEKNLIEQKTVISPIIDVLINENIIPAILPAEELREVLPVPMYVVTNSKKYFGAAHIMNPNVMENLQNIFQDEFYIFPSSIHESATRFAA